MVIKEQIKIMQRYLAGDTIVFFDLYRESWIEICPNQEEYSFDFENYDYKVKPKELTLEEKVKAKYPDYEVVMLAWDERNRWVMQDSYLHVDAQSRKGFYRYVYQHPHYDWDTCTIPTMQWTKDETIQPVAVLFEREK
jgi:hypothetical protein